MRYLHAWNTILIYKKEIKEKYMNLEVTVFKAKLQVT